MSRVLPSSLRDRYTPGLHAPPLTIMSGAYWGSPGGARTATSTTNWTSFFGLSEARVCMLCLEMHAFPDTLLHLETHAFQNACVNLISAHPSRFASPPTKIKLTKWAQDALHCTGERTAPPRHKIAYYLPWGRANHVRSQSSYRYCCVSSSTGFHSLLPNLFWSNPSSSVFVVRLKHSECVSR